MFNISKLVLVLSLCLGFFPVTPANAGITWAKRIVLWKKNSRHHEARAAGGPGGNAVLSYKGGSVLIQSKTKAIFWGTEWEDTAFAGDKITGMDSFFKGFNGSQYASIASEYYSKSGTLATFITSQSTYLGSVIDNTKAPAKALTVSAAVLEACKITGNQPDPAALYAIYTSTTAGAVSYCAWHSWGTCSNGAPVQVAYLPNIDGELGCDPEDSITSHSQGLAALANVTAHELMETITDPRGAGWLDNQKAEIGDKCAWIFPAELVTFTDNDGWKLQMEWSNAAYAASSGAANSKGQLGCVY